MTPKEKAKEIVYKFYDEIKYMERAKQCAMIAVDEIIASNPMLPSNLNWLEVKQEIEKL